MAYDAQAQHYCRGYPPEKRLSRDKHSSLFCHNIRDKLKKKFYKIDTRFGKIRGVGHLRSKLVGMSKNIKMIKNVLKIRQMSNKIRKMSKKLDKCPKNRKMSLKKLEKKSKNVRKRINYLSEIKCSKGLNIINNRKCQKSLMSKMI